VQSGLLLLFSIPVCDKVYSTHLYVMKFSVNLPHVCGKHGSPQTKMDRHDITEI
jgi:hypothetical protein